MPIDFWFPTTILNENIENYKEINSKLMDKILKIEKSYPSGGSNWLAAPYNTCGTYDISKDESFENIINIVTNKVNFLAENLGVNTEENKFKCKEGWLNIYKSNQFQEFHYHAGFKFSAVYYVKVPNNSSGIVFESPLGPDMNPLPTTRYSNITDKQARYSVCEGQLLVFRSYLRHCVPPHTIEEERVSIAFNFGLE